MQEIDMRFKEFSIFSERNSDVRWAVGNNIDKSIGNKFYQTSNDYVLVQANIEDLFRLTDRYTKLDLEHPTGGENAIGKRIANATSHWKSGGYMDPSEIGVNTNNPNHPITFGNGRHRLYAAYQMGEKFAPVLVRRENLKDLQNLVRTK